MSTITLVRHGQANTGAHDEDSYDMLSSLGHQQAAWLGAHMIDTGAHFERVYTGTLRRHVETAASMGAVSDAPPIRDTRLNELEFFPLAAAAQAQHGLTPPQNREGFMAYFPRLMTLWQQDKLDNPPEAFAQFDARVRDVMAEIHSGRGPALVVTSGGLIAMVMRQVMGLDTHNMAMACLAIMNSSVHRLHRLGDHIGVTQFNAVPHLDLPDRQFAQTHL